MKAMFFIKVVNKDNEPGYVIDSPDGIKIASEYISTVKLFKTYQYAQAFVRMHKLDDNGIKVYIEDTGDLINQGKGFKAKSGEFNYTVVNQDGHPIFYDAKEEGYYFDDAPVGFCAWHTENEVNGFIKEYNLRPDIQGKWFPKKVMEILNNQKNNVS